jgi:hypothetical protein
MHFRPSAFSKTRCEATKEKAILTNPYYEQGEKEKKEKKDKMLCLLCGGHWRRHPSGLHTRSNDRLSS